MENEVIQTVLTEVLEELKEVRQQQVAMTKALLQVQENLAGFEAKLDATKIGAPTIDIRPIKSVVDAGIDKIKSTIEAQPKTIIKQYRILLFPEYNAGEYYKLVFGRVLFWMLMFLVVRYLYLLGKEFIGKY